MFILPETPYKSVSPRSYCVHFKTQIMGEFIQLGDVLSWNPQNVKIFSSVNAALKGSSIVGTA